MLRRLLLALGLVAALLALVLVAVSRGWQRERVTRLVAGIAADALGQPVRVGAIEGSGLGDLGLRDVAIGDAADPALEADHVVLRFDAAAFWRERALDLDALVVEGLRLAVERTPDGWRLRGFRAKAGGARRAVPPLRRVEVRSFALRRARVHGVDAARATSVRAEVEADGRGFAWRAGEPLRLPESLRTSLATADARLEGRAIDAASLTLALDERARGSGSLRASGPFGRVSGTLELTLAHRELPLALASAGAVVEVQDFDPAPLVADERLASRLGGRATLRFEPVANAPLGTGVLRFETALAAAPGAPLGVARVAATGSFDAGRSWLALDALALRGAFGRVDASGSGSKDALDAAELRASLRLEGVPAAWLPLRDLRGTAEIAADARGPWKDPLGQLRLALDARRGPSPEPLLLQLSGELSGGGSLALDRLSLAAAGLTLAAEPGARLAVDAERRRVDVRELALEGGALSLRLSGAVSPAGYHGARVELGRAALAPLAARLGLAQPWEGEARGVLTADGAFAAPRLSAELAAAPLRAGEVRFSRAALSARSEGPALVFDAEAEGAGREPIVARGQVDRAALLADPASVLQRADSRLEIHAPALDAAWLARSLGQREPGSGDIALEVVLTGAAPLPRAQGQLRLTGGALALPGSARVEGITARLSLDGDTLRVRSLRVPGARGELNARGHLSWAAGDRAPETDLLVRARSFGLPEQGPVVGDVVGSMRVGGRWPDLRAQGRFVLAHATVRVPQRRVGTWSEIRVHGHPEISEEAAEPVAPLQLPALAGPASADVALEITPDARVLATGADLRVRGEVRLLKRPGEEPLFTGSVRAEEGRVTLRGKRFEVERGVATLVGTRELDPELDAVAALKLQEVTLRIVVSGRMSAPVIALESEPPLDPSDQLSYLAFGRPASSLSATDAAGLQRAATQVVGELLLSSGLGSGLLGRLPLDRLSFEAGDEKTQLGLGAEIAPGLRLHYARGRDRSDSRARVEWRFRPGWSVQSEVSESGEAGADVIWSREF